MQLAVPTLGLNAWVAGGIGGHGHFTSFPKENSSQKNHYLISIKPSLLHSFARPEQVTRALVAEMTRVRRIPSLSPGPAPKNEEERHPSHTSIQPRRNIQDPLCQPVPWSQFQLSLFLESRGPSVVEVRAGQRGHPRSPPSLEHRGEKKQGRSYMEPLCLGNLRSLPGFLPGEPLPTASACSAPPPSKPLRGRSRLCPQENGSARQDSLVQCQGPGLRHQGTCTSASKSWSPGALSLLPRKLSTSPRVAVVEAGQPEREAFLQPPTHLSMHI
jgi:hypothetical protein